MSMKRYTSPFLKTVALMYMAFPIAYVTLAAMVFDIPIASCVRLLLAPSYYIVSIVAVLAGYGLWEMYRWSWHLFIASGFFIGYETAVVMNQFSETHHKVLAFIVSIVGIIGVAMRVSREVRVPYFFPKIRWWESNPRYRLAVPVEIYRNVTGEKINGEILDVSLSGCFVKVRGDLKTDEPVRVRFQVFRLPVEAEGVIVWRSQSTVTHPKGVGVKFMSYQRPNKRSLRMITKRLKQIANFYRTSRYLLSQEDFLKKLEQIESEDFGKKKVQIKENVS